MDAKKYQFVSYQYVFFFGKNGKIYIYRNPLYWDAYIKTQVTWKNRLIIKHAFSHMFIRIQVGYTAQYVDMLKSYMTKKPVL